MLHNYLVTDMTFLKVFIISKNKYEVNISISKCLMEETTTQRVGDRTAEKCLFNNLQPSGFTEIFMSSGLRQGSGGKLFSRKLPCEPLVL